ncbi:universal stress protein [Pectinatus brassicae]|uniref:Nucleotide-binding universal stress UspA family protein n=1 Tax=Pectinatus brassicae TaxID=862415 RepID=A0A840UDD1_9FIRM|nr:universal stress protein [Pectinatus brassicae]MBB5335741.1 nucleotide-binding universal stress UspA family protein [Pectinatus brassicae]
MREFKSILVPIDGSAHSEHALQQAKYIAGLSNAALTILYVIDLNTAVTAFERLSMNTYIPDDIDAQGKEVLEKAKGIIGDLPNTDYELRVGDPAKIILSYSKDKNMDLIVMGSRGLGAIKQIIMGSVSQYLATHAECPVLVVR